MGGLDKRNLVVGIVFPAIFVLVAIWLHLLLFPVVLSDIRLFVIPWTDILREYGPDSIKAGFSNYNTPYLLLLWIFGKAFSSGLLVPKVIAVVFDVIAAIGIFNIVAHFHPKSPLRLFAATLYLIVPTVIYNSGAWGQCDGILGAITVWALYFCLKDRLAISWVFVGVCFAFKLQGIFLAPFLLAVALNRRKTFLSGPVLAAATTAVMSAPTLVYGDSVSRIFNVFVSGTGDMLGERYLSWWMANLHQWLPNDLYGQFRIVGVGIALLFVALLAISGFRSPRLPDEALLVLAAFSLILIPFVLPQMHGRYYFQGEAILFTLIFIRFRPAQNFVLRIVSACVIQLVTMSTFLILEYDPLPQMHWVFRALSIAVVFVLFITGREYLLYSKYGMPGASGAAALKEKGGVI